MNEQEKHEYEVKGFSRAMWYLDSLRAIKDFARSMRNLEKTLSYHMLVKKGEHVARVDGVTEGIYQDVWEIYNLAVKCEEKYGVPNKRASAKKAFEMFTRAHVEVAQVLAKEENKVIRRAK